MTDKRNSSAIEFLARADLATDIDIHRVGAAVDLSPSRFRHLFKRRGSVHRKRYSEKAQTTRILLQVKQVMLMVGYQDPSHSVRDYKRTF